MNLLTAYLIVGSMYGFLFLISGFLIYWLRKNDINVQITKGEEGVFMSSGGRYRIAKGQLYHMKDFFKKKPLISEEEIKDYIIITEGLPVIGVKKTLKLFNGMINDDKEESLKPWFPVFNDDIKPELLNSKIAFTETTRKDLYEATKLEMSKAEIMQKIVLPMGMLVLAIACLIFFPKIYAAIKSEGNIAIKTAISRFGELMEGFAPLG
jgi:hypothetical protein